MPSATARIMNAAIRLTMRRRSWGDERGLVRRARRLFGMPPALRRFWNRGVQVVPTGGAPAGEWIIPHEGEDGHILFFHGGGYVAGSVADHRPMTAGLARRTKLRVFSPDYRLAPEHRFPAALDDCFAAYRWLLDQGINPGRLAVAGDSAGGGLVLSTLVRVRDAGLPLPATAVCFSPWTDLSASGDSARTMDGRCHMFRTENLHDFASVYLGDASPRDPQASPLFAELAGLPPVLFQVGSTELLVDDSRRAHEQILACGGSSRLAEFEDVVHAWQMLDGIVPEAGAALDEAAAFIRSGGTLT